MNPQLGMKVAGDFGTGLITFGLVTEHDAGNDRFVLQTSAAMVRKSRIVVADDPHPVEPRGQFLEQVSGVGGKAIAAEAVVKLSPRQ